MLLVGYKLSASLSKALNLKINSSETQFQLRWSEPSYMPVGYVFKYSFSAETISPISMILATLIKNGEIFRKFYLFFCRCKNVRDIGICLKPHFHK